MAAGRGFTLTQHDGYPDGDNSFKTLWVEHEARNNLELALGEALSRLTGLAEAGAATLLQFSDEALEPGTYRNRFGCVRKAVAIVPQCVTYVCAVRIADTARSRRQPAVRLAEADETSTLRTKFAFSLRKA